PAFELLYVESDLPDARAREEIEDSARLEQRLPRQHADHGEGDAGILQTAHAFHDALECAEARARAAVAVVQILRSVEADADPRAAVEEKPAPGVGDQQAVGLEAGLHLKAL